MRILLDNAAEAASASAAPLLTVEFHNAESDMEVVVRNTSADGLRLHDMPAEDHEGLGLRTLERLMDKQRNVLFNLYPRGRFVEAQLLIS